MYDDWKKILPFQLRMAQEFQLQIISENRISKEFINSLEPIRFSGKIELVDHEQKGRDAVEVLSREQILGFDTESRPAFKKGESYPISLIQIATHETVYLFHLTAAPFFQELAEILSNPEINKIGIGLKNDFGKLQELGQITPRGFVDLGEMASHKGIIQQGARSLTARYLSRRLIKSAQRTNWARRKLSAKQMIYAATDAWICLQIYPLILADSNIYTDPDSAAQENLPAPV